MSILGGGIVKRFFKKKLMEKDKNFNLHDFSAKSSKKE
ncbi:hypothetical protein lbkm_1850 [Lachnospiraceae bacterium KM106-2]|nr:hypothetical protein lbkm_1850 [Lachnospiraceae bacterium KM106-2]